MPREEALEEAIARTSNALESRESTNPLIQRVHMIRDIVFEATKLHDIIDIGFIQNKLGCADHEADRAIERAMQLYPEIKVKRLFDHFRYFYHVSMTEGEQGDIGPVLRGVRYWISARQTRPHYLLLL
jgi:hypothetical protein